MRLTDPFRPELLAHCYRMVGSFQDAEDLEKTAWPQPLPGPGSDAADPAAIVGSRDSVRLALIAARPHLPAKQRVALILRDVPAWRASEVADLLGTTSAAVNSLLQRARAHLRRVSPAEDEPAGHRPHRLRQRPGAVPRLRACRCRRAGNAEVTP